MSGHIYAQTNTMHVLRKLPKINIVDEGNVEVIYEHIVIDPVLDQFDPGNPLILQIGRKSSKFTEYSRFRVDSVLYVNKIESMSFMDYQNLLIKYDYERRYTYPIYTFLDTTSRVYDEKYSIWGSYYAYQDVGCGQDWQLEDGTDIICGYACSVATVEFRGRKWKAWFADNLPIPEGPFKFYGLPGLILKMESFDGEHRVEAISIRRASIPILMKDDGASFKTTREKTLSLLKEKSLNPQGFLKSMSESSDVEGVSLQPAITRLFYNPLEKE